MVLSFKHEFRNHYQEHVFLVNDKNNMCFCEGHITSNLVELIVDFNFADEKVFIKFDHESYKKNVNEKPMMSEKGVLGLHDINFYYDAHTTAFFDMNHQMIGQIKNEKLPGKIWAERILFDFRGIHYTGYYVAKAGKGLFYFIVDENDKTVAAIQQNKFANNNIFGYTIFAENPYYSKLGVMFLVFADNFKYGGKRVYSGARIKGETTLVAQPKEVKRHYDPEFIQRVKQMETKG